MHIKQSAIRYLLKLYFVSMTVLKTM